jgi:sucrose-6-phosphate hydrolase SacC (GH32 family)
MGNSGYHKAGSTQLHLGVESAEKKGKSMRKLFVTALVVILVSPFLYGAQCQKTCRTSEYRSPIHFMPQLPTKKCVGDVMPFYWKGEYHVFYLTNPLGNRSDKLEGISAGIET